MKLWKITYSSGATNNTIGETDIWTGKSNIISVELLPEQTSTQPTSVSTWDEYDFRLRFTRDERKGILAASKVNADIEDFEAMLQTAGRTNTRIKSDDKLLNEAMKALVDGGLLDDSRRKEILGITD